MSKRQGKAGGATPSKLAGAPIDDKYDEGEKSQKLAAEAVRSIQTCYRICFASVLADVIITIIEGDLWPKFFSADDGENADVGGDADPSPPELSWVDCVDLCDSLVHLAFGCGLYRIGQCYLASMRNGRIRSIGEEKLLDLLRTMAAVWGFVAINFSLVAVSMASALPTQGRDGPLHFLLAGVSSRDATLTASAVLVFGGMATSAYCRKTAVSEDRADNKQIGARQRKSKMSAAFVTSRRMGYRTYRNQALCVWSFGLKAVMELLNWVADPNAGIIDRALSASDVWAPFVISWLLLRLNRSFLRAAIVRLRDDRSLRLLDDGSDSTDEEMYENLFVAQTGFYRKVSETMKDATTFRLLPYLVRPFWPKILEALEEVSPSFAAKIVQLLDFFA